MPPFPTWPSKRSRKSRSEASFSSLTSLMMINQNLTRQITALKAEIEEAKCAIETVEKQVLCKACKTYDRGVYLTCGDLVCEPCAADIAAAEKKVCPACARPTSLGFMVKL